MDTVKQNRITRKKLRKAVKRQAAKRAELQEELNKARKSIWALRNANANYARLFEEAIRDVLSCVNESEFPKNAYVMFDLAFMKMSYINGSYHLQYVRFPTEKDFE